MNNKREYLRYNIFLEDMECFDSGNKNKKLDISDISCSGLGIISNDKLVKGEKIELEVKIPNDDIPMFVGGEVAWVSRQKGKEGYYRVGVRLSNINRLDKDRLVKFIHSNIFP
ncbi:MAG: PilZ domain-containing protein [Candidatus Omnitrophota bacterium]